MKRAILMVLFLGVTALSSGAFYWEHSGDYPGTVTLSASQVITDSFVISAGNTYYLYDSQYHYASHEITTYNTEFEIADQFAFLDAHFPMPNVNPLNPNIVIEYIGGEPEMQNKFGLGNERPWGESYRGDINFWMVLINPSVVSGQLVEFVYVPEPATLVLLGLGGVILQKRRKW